MPPPEDLPGSAGEHTLQEKFGTRSRAEAFYRSQVLDRLNPSMRSFIARQELVFVATSDARGECDSSFRAGLPGFVCVLDETTLAYPEYRGNGVLASIGNVSENPHIGLLFLDFFASAVGLHVNGRAKILEHAELLERSDLPDQLRNDPEVNSGRRPERWVLVAVEEAYIHCSKHVPLLSKQKKKIDWGTDDLHLKGGDFFGARGDSCPGD